MKTVHSSLPLLAVLTACSATPVQVLQGLGSVTVDVDYIKQSKRICAQKNDPALRFQCEQQAQKEFQKFQVEQRKKNNE